MREHEVMVCAPADQQMAVPGSAIMPATCGHDILMSPSGLDTVLSTGVETQCLACFGGVARMAEVAQAGEAFVSPAVAASLRNTLGAEQADRLLEHFGIKEDL